MPSTRGSLSALPPELLLHILSFLPVRGLLAFSCTSRIAHELAKCSLHTLSFGVFQSRIASVASCLSISSLPHAPEAVRSSFDTWTNRALMHAEVICCEDKQLDDMYGVDVIVPDFEILGYDMVSLFQSTLTTSIITRFSRSLQHLDLSLWYLSTSVSIALKGCEYLRSLSIRFEEPNARQKMQRLVRQQKTEESICWLNFEGTWPRLEALRIEGAELSDDQCLALLSNRPLLREVWLRRCMNLTSTIWEHFKVIRDSLQILSIGGLRGSIDGKTLQSIGQLRKLQYLALQGCKEASPGIIKTANELGWHIPELILPQTHAVPLDFIEVDPLYQAEYSEDLLTQSRALEVDTLPMGAQERHGVPRSKRPATMRSR